MKIFIILIILFLCFPVFAESARDDIKGGEIGVIAFYSLLGLIVIGVIVGRKKKRGKHGK